MRPPQIIVITHRGAEASEIDHYISTLFAPATVLYMYSRWGKDPKNELAGKYTFYEVTALEPYGTRCFLYSLRVAHVFLEGFAQAQETRERAHARRAISLSWGRAPPQKQCG